MGLEVTRINDELFAKLCQIFADKSGSILKVLNHLRRQLWIQSIRSNGRLLCGQRKDDDLAVYQAGQLIAVAPGIVILNNENDSLPNLRPLSGLMARNKANNNAALFSLRPFSPPHIGASLYIYPSTFPDQPRFQVCPVWIRWQMGSGQGESYDALGIPPGSWRTLGPWLDQWLPAE